MGARSFRMGLVFSFFAVAAWATPACGGSDEDEGGGPTAGSGGKGGSSGSAGAGAKGGTSGAGGSAEGGMVTTIDCKGKSCQGAALPDVAKSFVPEGQIAPCCAGAGGDQCGLETAPLSQLDINFNPTCQAKNQPGNEDANCPKALLPIMNVINIEIPGCCRPNGKCGYLANKLGQGAIQVELDLGCVDSAPFLDGGAPPDCTGGGDGSGGSGGSSSDASADVSTD